MNFICESDTFVVHEPFKFEDAAKFCEKIGSRLLTQMSKEQKINILTPELDKNLEVCSSVRSRSVSVRLHTSPGIRYSSSHRGNHQDSLPSSQ